LTPGAGYATLKPMKSNDEIQVYTDGSAIGNPGPGGWAALIQEGSRVREISGGFRETTNNRMELYAAIMALEVLPAGARIRLFSDSSYLVEGISQGWAETWRAKGWRQTKNKPTPNADLWARLLTAAGQRSVSWEWVRGHVGHKENERANLLAQRAAMGRNLPADEGYENQPAGTQNGQPGLFDGSVTENMPAEGENAVVKPAERRGKVVREGQPCRKCGTPVVKRAPKRKLSGKQSHYYEYYLVCPKCDTIYLVDEAKKEV